MDTLSSFDYELPPELIARYPRERRDSSRLLTLSRDAGAVQHLRFTDLPELIGHRDIVVVNRSRVIPARLKAIRENGREAEVLLVRELSPGRWSAMVHPGGKLKKGRKLSFGHLGGCEVVEVLGGGLRVLEFENANVDDICRAYGSMPLPPYIGRPVEELDSERYQTIFAREKGSVAAPTAGLHFTPEVVESLGRRGIAMTEIILHVGPGTFKPVTTEDISRHHMHSEYYEIPPGAARMINQTREKGGKVWAVGTTTARVLETCTTNRTTRSDSGFTNIFIRPPYRFRGIDALVTNFHLPRSTLLMLVAAFAGLEATLAAYREAVATGYRFFSYGDSMVIH